MLVSFFGSSWSKTTLSSQSVVILQAKAEGSRVQGRRVACLALGFPSRLRSAHRLAAQSSSPTRTVRSASAPFWDWTKGRGRGCPEKKKEAGAQKMRRQATWLRPAEAGCVGPRNPRLVEELSLWGRSEGRTSLLKRVNQIVFSEERRPDGVVPIIFT